jgi:hypothetical protein
MQKSEAARDRKCSGTAEKNDRTAEDKKRTTEAQRHREEHRKKDKAEE